MLTGTLRRVAARAPYANVMPNMDELLINTINTLESEFREDELALLALTSKIELPWRDRWAYSIHRQIKDAYDVSREWRRTDLAILDDNKPVALIELKAMYSFDATLCDKEINGYCELIQKDEQKALALSNGSCSVYTVLLAAHPHSSIPAKYDRVIKYRQGINKAMNEHNTQEQVAAVAQSNVEACLSHKKIIASGNFMGGKAFGVPASVYYWLVKA